MATTPPMIGGADPSVLRSLETQTPSVARTSPPTVSATTGSATSGGTAVARSIAPQVSGDTITYNQATQTVSGASLTITSATSNEPADVVTVFNSNKAISVSAVNQTVNSYNVNNYSGNEYTDNDVANYLPTFNGNVGAGNVNVTGTVYTSGISSTALASLTILNVSTTANLGAVGGVIITGGSNGQVLTTNGSNVLSWTTVSGGNGSYSNNDVANYLPTFTGNIGANVVTANLFVGSGANLTNIAGANVSGFVANANIANTAFAVAGANVSGFVPNANVSNTAFAVAGANVSGFVPNANVSNTAFAVALANVSGVGNIASINLDGNLSNILYGNGVFASAPAGGGYGNSNVATFLASYGSNTMTTTGNVSVGNIIGNGQALTGLAGANVSGFVPNANVANTAFAVAAANVSGLGNIATINLDGNLSNILYGNGVFASAPAGGLYGDSNVVTLLASYGSNTITTTGNVSVGNIIGNGQALTGLAGANVTGAVTYASTANSVALANVSGAGNIASINISGNASQILYGNGVFASAPVTYGNSNVATFLASYGSNTITTTGNVTVGNIIGNGQALTGLAGANVSGQVGNALVAGTVYTNAQPNITSVGTLTSLSVTGNANVGNLGTATAIITTGNITTINSSLLQNGNSNITLTANGNVSIQAAGSTVELVVTSTGANITGTLDATGNITGGNISTSGNVSAGNVIINGQPTTYGVVSPDYINMTTSAAVNVAASGTDLTWDVNNGSSGIAYSAGKFSLTAGKTYHVLAEIAMQNFNANGYLLVELVDGTTNARIGSQTLSIPYNTGFNEANNPTLDIVHTPVANQDVKLRVTGGSSGLTAQLRSSGFTRMSIVQLNSTIAVQATATGTVATNYAKYVRTTAQTVSANTVVVCSTLESSSGTAVSVNTSTGQVTLTAGTYRLRGTVGSMLGFAAAAMIGYSWYNETTSAYIGEGAGFNGPTSTAWNASSGGTAEAVITVASTTVVSFRVVSVTNTSSIGGTSADFGAPYAYPWIDIEQIGSIFALNTLDTMTTTGNVSVGGNLTVTGNISGNTNGFSIGYLNIPQVAASNATLGLTDAGKHYYSTTAGNITLTVPLNSSVAFATGTAVSIVVQAAGNVLVNAASGVTLYMGGNATAGNRVVGTYGMATLMKVASDTWFISGAGVA